MIGSVVLARAADSLDSSVFSPDILSKVYLQEQIHYYTLTGRQSRRLKDLIPPLVSSASVPLGQIEDLKAKYVEAVKLDLEAALNLQKWEYMDTLFQVPTTALLLDRLTQSGVLAIRRCSRRYILTHGSHVCHKRRHIRNGESRCTPRQ